nr:Response regulator protein TodT [Cupriavidus sp.]
MKKTIVLLDDDMGVRLAIARALEFAGFQVMAFSSGQDLLARVSEVLHQAAGQVGFLLDMRMPAGVSGLEVMRRLRERGIAHPIVFLSGEAHLQEAIEALKAGASDFLLKPVDHEKLVQALRRALDAVVSGHGQSDADVPEAPIDLGNVFTSFQGQPEEPEGPGAEGFAALTRREQEVLSFVLKGFRSLQIASALRISERTVKMHRSNIMAKVGAQGATHLVYLYQQFRRGHSGVA